MRVCTPTRIFQGPIIFLMLHLVVFCVPCLSPSSISPHLSLREQKGALPQVKMDYDSIFKYLLIVMCMSTLLACICVHPTCVRCSQMPKEALDPLELELQAVVNCQGCWELSQGPMKEKAELLTRATSREQDITHLSETCFTCIHRDAARREVAALPCCYL